MSRAPPQRVFDMAQLGTVEFQHVETDQRTSCNTSARCRVYQRPIVPGCHRMSTPSTEIQLNPNNRDLADKFRRRTST